MKGKKLLSMLTAGALAVTMVMPVMAADDGGSFDADVTTKTGVVRVEVPTSMAIAVDQFEITHTGNQIAAGEFDMTNKSEMDVKVTITSTATPAAGVNLVSTAKAAQDSTGADAWLGVAAKTNDGTANSGKEYDDLKTGTDADAKVEDFWELTDANANVTSFAADTKKAEQVFYLAKGTGSAEYKLAVPDATEQVKKTFAKFYELTENTAIDDNTKLKTAVEADDVYVVATGDIAKDGASVEKLAKGSTVADNTYAGTNKYYTAAADASTPANSKIYVYAAMANDGGKAGFTYIGKLGGKETWSATDIGTINIAYKIAGVTGTRYAEVLPDCTYGLYAEAIKACKLQTIASGTGTDITAAITADKGIYIKVGSEFLKDDASKLTSVKLNETALTITTKGNSSGNDNAVYFKLPSGTTVKSGDKFIITVDGKNYSFTVA